MNERTTVERPEDLPEAVGGWRIRNEENRRKAWANIKVYRTAYGLVTVPE